jgi:tetratricopeptide (TPR) repeat protein
VTIEKAAEHFDQAQYDLAEKEARDALAADPDNPLGLAVLAMALTRLGRGEDAIYEAEAAIALAPTLAVGYVAHAQALSSINQFTRARRSAAEAIRLEPQDPDNHALLAHVEAASNRWAEVYEATSGGLAVAADHAELKRLRSVAAVHLGKLEEADEETIEALRVPPAAPGTIAGRGHDLLLTGRVEEAQQAFLSVIRTDPTSDLARAGLVEAVKAGNVFYALVLGYFEWASRLTLRRQIALSAGPVIPLLAIRFLIGPGIPSELLFLVEIGWWVVVATIWLAAPLWNLVLIVHPVGGAALREHQRQEATLVAGLLVVAGVGVFLYVLGIAGGWVLAGAGLVTGVAASAAFRPATGWPRTLLTVMAVAVAVLGAAASGLALLASGQLATTVAPVIFYVSGVLAIAAMAIADDFVPEQRAGHL